VLFSVIIPTYNRAHLLPEALESVWRQTFTDYEVIVVDDGSTDGTADYLRSLCERVRVISQLNLGPGAARNLGAQYAKGDYIAFLDSDDLWFPWTLATYASVISRNEHPTLISGNWVTFREARPRHEVNVHDIQSTAFANLLEACAGPVPPVGGTPSIALRTRTLLKVGGFCQMRINGEDTDLWLRLGLEPGFVRIHHPPVFAQRIHADNITSSMERAITGVRYQIQQEIIGAYPGNAKYRRKRIKILAASVRNVSLQCQRSGHVREAWGLYLRTFLWQISFMRIRYVIAFPLLALAALVRHRKTQ
jgi:glycosyltransferase involved in cell wall biosynthesis